MWYGDFSQTTDEEVHDLLGRAEEGLTTASR
jgi:predicted phosphoribosyltransferase